MGFNTPDDVAGGMARFIAVTGGIEGIEDEFRLMNEVTPEDIMEAAKQFDTNKMTVVRLIGEGN